MHVKNGKPELGQARIAACDGVDSEITYGREQGTLVEARPHEWSYHSELQADMAQPLDRASYLHLDQAYPRPPSTKRTSDRREANSVVPRLCDTDSGINGKARARTPRTGQGISPTVRGVSPLSNRKLVRNAIDFLCLAGGHLQEQKARALEVCKHSRISKEHKGCAQECKRIG